MEKKERILNALKGKPVDRVPTSWYTHFPDQRDNTVADQVAWARETDMDMLCIETDGFMEFDCGKTDLSDPEVLANLKPHNPGDWYIEGQVDRARRIAEGLRDGAAVTTMLFTPFSTIKHSTHSETLVMKLLREHPKAVTHAMEVIEQDNFTLLERLAGEAGLDGVFLSLQNNEIDRYSAEEYARLLAPWDERVIARARSLFPMTILHLCAWRGVPNRVEAWRRYGCDVVNWAAHIEPDLGLAQGRRFFGGPTLMGGFDNRPCGILHWGDEQQIKAYTRRLLDNAGPRRLILSADCSVQGDTPPEHLRWVAEASEAYVREKGLDGSPAFQTEWILNVRADNPATSARNA